MGKEFGEGHRPRHGTLGWLAELFYSGSEAEATANLKEHLPDAAFGDRYIVAPADAPRVLRTDAPESVGISYHSYNPPAIWGAGYSVMRVTFPPSVPTEFMSHAGEELLVPVSGRVQYQFFWAPPGDPPERAKLEDPVSPFEMIRINPQSPHHTWAVEGSAEAWMIFRDVSEVPAAIIFDPSLPTRGPVQLHPRTLSREDLLDPSRYALTAWGIAERTRLHRERAGLGVQELAALADVDPAQLSRLEAGTRNLSLDALLRVARVLRIPLLDLIETARWRFDRSGDVGVPEGGSPTPVLRRPPGLRHWLHAHTIGERLAGPDPAREEILGHRLRHVDPSGGPPGPLVGRHGPGSPPLHRVRRPLSHRRAPGRGDAGGVSDPPGDGLGQLHLPRGRKHPGGVRKP